MTKLLIVEDDIEIAAGLEEFLNSFDYELDFAYNGEQALSLISSESYDLIVLDLNLPKISGLAICEMLTKEHLSCIPVIITTALGSNEDILKGFNVGAWDYLVKPYSLSELQVRIQVTLAKNSNKSKISLSHGNWNLDIDTCSFRNTKYSAPLQKTGFAIVEQLFTNFPSIVRFGSLTEAVWGTEMDNSEKLRAQIYKLRTQFKSVFGAPLIVTVKNIGYRLELDG